MAGDSKGPMGHPDHVSERTIAITGGDAGYFDLIEDCVGSLRAAAEGRALALGILDCGLTEEQRTWCREQGATLVVPQWDFDFPGRDKLKDGYKALTARPFLPRYFPGFDLYLLINAGVFALKADAPHWGGWADVMGEALQRSTNMTDQIALNVLVYDKGFTCEPLPSRCNWPIHHATPAWDAERSLFVEPAMPYDPLGILHMTIYTKRLATLDVRELGGPHDGQVRPRSLRWPGRTAI